MIWTCWLSTGPMIKWWKTIMISPRLNWMKFKLSGNFSLQQGTLKLIFMIPNSGTLIWRMRWSSFRLSHKRPCWSSCFTLTYPMKNSIWTYLTRRVRYSSCYNLSWTHTESNFSKEIMKQKPFVHGLWSISIYALYSLVNFWDVMVHWSIKNFVLWAIRRRYRWKILDSALNRLSC